MTANRAGLISGALLGLLSTTAPAQGAAATGHANVEVYQVIPVSSQPPEPQRSGHFGLVLEADAEFGGDNIAIIYFDDNSDQDVETGQGISIAGGVHYRTASNLDIRGTLGYKYVTTKADNADIYVERFVLEAVADYFFASGWYLGAGVTQHTGISFHGDHIAPNLQFDDATGFTLEAGWSFIGLSYTFMDYEDEFGNKYNANNIGVSLIGRF